MTGLDYRAYWEAAFPWDDYLGREVRKHRELWEGIWARARTPDGALERLRETGGEWKLLVISEDWCGDASNTVPVLARLAADAPSLELRVVKRDENPALMDAYLTGAARSIPLAVVLGPDFAPVGRWGPRPAELQAFVLAEKRAGLRPAAEIYREVRQWYARDRGETTVRELLEVLAAAAAAR
ncbi:MAG TPA: thioredoxin family protein [Longimicrobiaceae bacterium]|nr:thioredoxin family protein [Longimicrobiaceae bacterium]